MLTSKGNNANASKVFVLKCNLLLIWSSTLLMDAEHERFWRNHCSQTQLVFVLQNALQCVVCFNDQFSKQMMKNIRSKAKQFKISQSVNGLKDAQSISNFVEPLLRIVKTDVSIDDLIRDRLEAQKFDSKLISFADMMQREERENDSSDDEEDPDLDSDDAMDDKAKAVPCKWTKCNDCKFLPIGHSILPPL